MSLKEETLKKFDGLCERNVKTEQRGDEWEKWMEDVTPPTPINGIVK